MEGVCQPMPSSGTLLQHKHIYLNFYWPNSEECPYVLKSKAFGMYIFVVGFLYLYLLYTDVCGATKPKRFSSGTFSTSELDETVEELSISFTKTYRTTSSGFHYRP